MTVGLLLLGLVLLIAGAELLVRGAVRCAESFKVSPLLIGLTLVGFGTSTPELVTSVQAALSGSPGIAVGNIVGSNIANILLVLGIAALIMPIAVDSRAFARDGALVVGVALLFTAVAYTTDLGRWVGGLFVALLAAYLAYAYREERRHGTDHTSAFRRAEAVGGVDPALKPRPTSPMSPTQPTSRAGSTSPTSPTSLTSPTSPTSPASATRSMRPRLALRAVIGALAIALVGLAIVVVGGRVLVDAAVELARLAGLSEEAVGLTIIAVGTSTPEVATSLVAAVRRQADLALGNVLGSNIYNLLGVGGLTALISPIAVPEQIARVDAPFMLGVSVLMVFFAWTEKSVSRVEGAVFLSFYVGYIGYLFAW